MKDSRILGGFAAGAKNLPSGLADLQTYAKTTATISSRVAGTYWRGFRLTIWYNQLSGKRPLVRSPAALVFPGPHSASRSYQHVLNVSELL
jgi:hypothetical protein